jgi:hypothetical protein
MRSAAIFFAIFFIIGCSTPGELISQSKIYPGMSKSAFRAVMLYNLNLNDDAYQTGCFREYFPDLRHEIISSSSQKMFYVFKYVTEPGSMSNCSKEGNGVLVGSYNSYQSAKSVIKIKKLDRFDMPALTP